MELTPTTPSSCAQSLRNMFVPHGITTLMHKYSRTRGDVNSAGWAWLQQPLRVTEVSVASISVEQPPPSSSQMELTPSVPPSCAQNLLGHVRAAEQHNIHVQILADVNVTYHVDQTQVTWIPQAWLEQHFRMTNAFDFSSVDATRLALGRDRLDGHSPWYEDRLPERWSNTTRVNARCRGFSGTSTRGMHRARSWRIQRRLSPLRSKPRWTSCGFACAVLSMKRQRQPQNRTRTLRAWIPAGPLPVTSAGDGSMALGKQVANGILAQSTRKTNRWPTAT